MIARATGALLQRLHIFRGIKATLGIASFQCLLLEYGIAFASFALLKAITSASVFTFALAVRKYSFTPSLNSYLQHHK
jgi:hypothetical protein